MTFRHSPGDSGVKLLLLLESINSTLYRGIWGPWENLL